MNHSTHQIPKAAKRKAALQTAGVAACICLVGLVSFVLYFRPYFQMSRQNQDIEGGVTGTGAGTVIAVSYPAAIKGNPNPAPIYRVRLNGVEYEYQAFAAVQVGKPAKVSYSVGKSGKVYLTGLESAK